MNNIIYAPFTDKQVKKLQAWQEGNVHFKEEVGNQFINVPPHPFTCCGHDGCTRPELHDDGILIPTKDGWICPCGKYKQDWCHDFMVGVK